MVCVQHLKSKVRVRVNLGWILFIFTLAPLVIFCHAQVGLDTTLILEINRLLNIISKCHCLEFKVVYLLKKYIAVLTLLVYPCQSQRVSPGSSSISEK